ncbi:MAG: transglutaminase-like domain-containing protein [Pirellulales bacterium]
MRRIQVIQFVAFVQIARIVSLAALAVALQPGFASAGPARSANQPHAAEGRPRPEVSDSRGSWRLGEPKKQRLRVGVEIAAQGSPLRGVLATLPLPINWPEQEARVIDEDISENVQDVTYRVLEDNVEQMVVRIPQMDANETAHVMLTIEIDRFTQLDPPEPQSLKLPAKITRDLRGYLASSPYIETRHARIRQAAKEVKDPAKSPWDQVEAIYDYVREKVEYREGDLKGAAQALKDGYGDCEEMTSLFVALCRLNGVPARMVWVTDHCYPEFYLEDADGEGHWLPCQVAGTRAFGSMPDPRPILQKGDNILVPEKKSRERYVAEFLRVDGLRGNSPKVRFVREFAPVE